MTNFDTIEIYNRANSFQDLEVWLGKNTVKTHFKTIFIKPLKARLRNLKVILEYNGPIKAPIKKDQKLEKLKYIIMMN